MRKREFMQELRKAVCQSADESLQGTAWSSAGCPYIEHWLARYSQQDAQHIERAIRKYAPETAQAASAQDYIPIICTRVQRSVGVWLRTGQITGVPADVSTALPSGAPTPQQASNQTATGDKIHPKADTDAAASHADPEAIQARLGAGQPLDGQVRSRMESSFGTEFGQVQMHTDTVGSSLASGLNARAFTLGDHVAFGTGEYRPGTPVGDALIAHELAHVVQQRGQAVSGAVLSKDDTGEGSLEADADRSAVGVVGRLWAGVGQSLRAFGQNALPSLKSGLKLRRCNVAKAPASLATAEAKAKWITQAMSDDYSGASKEIVKVFKQAESPGEFIEIQKYLDMNAVIDYLALWDAVQVGMLGPVTVGEDKLNEKRADYIVEAVHKYGIARAQVFTHYFVQPMTNDDIKKVLSLLGADARLKSTIKLMPAVQELIKQHGVKLENFTDRDEGYSDELRGLKRGLGDWLGSSQLNQQNLEVEFYERLVTLPQEYQDIMQKATLEQIEAAVTSPSNVLLGVLNKASFGLSGMIMGTVFGIKDLVQGNYDEAGYELTGAVMTLTTYLGVKAYARVVNGPTIKGPAGPGQFVIKGFSGPITKEEARLGSILRINPEAQATAGLLFKRIGKRGVMNVARYLQEDKRAALLVHEYGLPAVEALEKAEGDIAKARAMLPKGLLVAPVPGPMAILPDGTAIPPDNYVGGYHGTSETPDLVMKEGLPARGTNWSLHMHTDDLHRLDPKSGGTAYRGTTPEVYQPATGQGAARWADVGGWVYEIRGVPTWDVKKALQGRVEGAPYQFRGEIMPQEGEYAVPARIPLENIKRYGQVVQDAAGRLKVVDWHDNPKYKPPQPQPAPSAAPKQ